MSAWTDHVERWKDCRACPLCDQRQQVVLARGSLPCDVLFNGQAPGVSEDATGLPFWGPAGGLMDKIVEAALAKRPDLRLAFCNLVACFPGKYGPDERHMGRGDKPPEPQHIKACRGRLVEFIRLAKPRLIVLVGQLSKKWTPVPAELSENGDGQPDWIEPGKWLEYCEIDHPAHVLKSPEVAQAGLIKRAVLRIRNAANQL